MEGLIIFGVVEEVKDLEFRFFFEGFISVGKVKVVFLLRESIEVVREVVKKMGEFGELSEVDIEVFVLVYEVDGVFFIDDYNF